MGKLKQLLIEYDDMSRETLEWKLQELEWEIEDLKEQIRDYQENYTLKPRKEDEG